MTDTERKTTILTDQERTIERLVQEKAELLAALRAITPNSCQSQAVASPNYDNGLRCDQQGKPQDRWCTACRARAAIAKCEGRE